MMRMLRVAAATALLAGALGAADGGIFLSAGWLGARDPAFREIYGAGGPLGEVELRLSLLPPVYAWAGYGITGRSGRTVPGRFPARSRQAFFSVGAGVSFWLGRFVNVLAEGGAVRASYREEALGVVLKRSAWGFRAGGALYYRGWGWFAPGIEAGWLSAKDAFEGRDVLLGGLRAAVALGFVF